MVKIEIEQALKSICPDLRLGVIQCRVKTNEDCPELWKEIDESIQKLESDLTIEKIREMPAIESSKNGYRAIGKDPNRYRLSAEALLRRIVNNKGLYKINNVVDLLNMVSIQSGFSIGGYNVDKIEGNIVFGIGELNEPYQGIGRGDLNIEKLPVFRDDKGAFGSPTSDSLRTQIDGNCTHFLMVIISFQGEKELVSAINHAQELLQKYAKTEEFEISIL